MAETLSIGDTAPNFDLESTESVVLMLCDEVPRLAVVLYFFTDPAAQRVREDLAKLAASKATLKDKRAVIMGVSPTQAETLKATQREIGLDFPLLFDDRDFSRSYGIEPPAEGQAEPALFLVDRDQKIRWSANPVESVETGLGEILAVLQRQPSPTYHYPKKMVNRIVDWWVNKFRRSQAA